jgi:lysophospholipase L1-like esterase
VVKRTLLVLFGCCLALGLAELGLRVFGYAGDAERARRVFDPRYGAVAHDSWIWHFQIDLRVHRAVDLRGQWIPLPKPPGETRVLFIGDSATEGAFVTPEQSFPRVFKALLDERTDNHVRVINAGVWGMTSIDEYHLLEDKLLPLDPDVVVIGLFMANDLNTNLAHRERAPRSSFGVTLRNHSALAHFLWLRALVLSAQRGVPAALVPVELRLVDSYGLHMLSYPAGELATYMVPPSALMEHAFEVLERVLADFKALGQRHGFTVRVLLIPSPSRVLGRLAILHYPNLLAELRASGVPIEPGQIDVDAPTKRVLAICDALHMTCIDPTARLQRLGGRAFFPHDEHPSALGQRALAEELVAH